MLLKKVKNDYRMVENLEMMVLAFSHNVFNPFPNNKFQTLQN